MISIGIDNLFLNGNDGQQKYNVEGFAFRRNDKPTYFLVGRWPDLLSNRTDYVNGSLIKVSPHLFDRYYLKDPKVRADLDLIFLGGEFKKGTKESLPEYGITVL